MLATISKCALPAFLLLDTAKSWTQVEGGEGEPRCFVSCRNKLHHSASNSWWVSQLRNIPRLIGVTLGGQRQKDMKILLEEGWLPLATRPVR